MNQPDYRILVILAHPDDESFPMGGTLAKYASEGANITLVCATRGEAGIPGLAAAATARIRTEELWAAATTLGIGDVRFLNHIDGTLAEIDPKVIVAQLAELMRVLQPQVILTFGPDGISGHRDHITIHDSVTVAFDEVGLDARLYYLAPSEATLQGCGVAPTTGLAGGAVAAIDIGAHRATKVRAMQCHASQNPPFAGSVVEEAERLVCHEYFILARPTGYEEQQITDLLGVLLPQGTSIP